MNHCPKIRRNEGSFVVIKQIFTFFQASVQLASSPKCVAQKKKEYQKSIAWASTQIKKQYEAKQKVTNAKPSVDLLEGLVGQLLISQ